MRPREFDSEAAADAIMRVFLKHGYAATSMDDLIRETGLSRSSIYNAFGSKQQMYQVALQQYHKTTSANVNLVAQDGPLKDIVRKLMMSVVNDELSGRDDRGCLVANSSLDVAPHDPQIAALVADHLTRLENALNAAIKRGQEKNELSGDRDSRALARFVVSSVQGLRVMGKGSAEQGRRRRLLDIVNITLDAL
ncbi:TetR family transcriptional regulator [Microvirga vignae]|uniref:TetR family transcriptional regulator n=2 Tax=Microvirga vignae TaxID=1225564 RepID=A0A0H1R9N3_9HYPH|nr:TetR family transcriptional regulator [Microvirga vignae]